MFARLKAQRGRLFLRVRFDLWRTLLLFANQFFVEFPAVGFVALPVETTGLFGFFLRL